MAEAAVDRNITLNRFYCHQCSEEIQPTLPDFTCPQCDNGFVEEIETRPAPQPQPVQQMEPAAQFAELWGRAFMESFSGQQPAQPEVTMATEEGAAGRPGRQMPILRHITTRQTRPARGNTIEGILQHLLGNIGESVFHGIPVYPNMLNLHGNPGDYAWGARGLDAIITQLLNHIEGSGEPPAEKEKIDALPTVIISQEQVDKILQCCVCMEDFAIDEETKKLPCDHHFHAGCIVPWLQVRGTCPICRKDLNGVDTTANELESNSESGGSSPHDESSHSSSME